MQSPGFITNSSISRDRISFISHLEAATAELKRFGLELIEMERQIRLALLIEDFPNKAHCSRPYFAAPAFWLDVNRRSYCAFIFPIV